MSVQLRQNGVNSATFLLVREETNDISVRYSDFTQLKAGRLKDVLTRAYLTEAGEPDGVAFMSAMADVGLMQWIDRVGVLTDSTWYLTSVDPGPSEGPVGTPYLACSLTDELPEYGNAAVLKIMLAYSASE